VLFTALKVTVPSIAPIVVSIIDNITSADIYINASIFIKINCFRSCFCDGNYIRPSFTQKTIPRLVSQELKAHGRVVLLFNFYFRGVPTRYTRYDICKIVYGTLQHAAFFNLLIALIYQSTIYVYCKRSNRSFVFPQAPFTKCEGNRGVNIIQTLWYILKKMSVHNIVNYFKVIFVFKITCG